jgi:WD40 repeat protein
MSFLNSRICCFLLLIPSLTFSQYNLSATLLGHTAPVNGIDISSDGKFLLSCSKDQSIRLWDLTKQEQLKVISSLPSSIKKVVLNPEGTKFYATGYNKVFYCDLQKFKVEKSYKAHAAFIESVSIQNDLLATTSWRDKSILIWKRDGFKKQLAMKDSVWTDCSTFSKDGKILITGDHANLIKLWDVNSGELITKFAGHTDWIYDLALSNDSKFLYSGSFDGSVRIWEMASQKNIGTLKEHTGGIVSIDLSKDGKYLVSAGVDKSILVWDTQERKVVHRIPEAHDGTILDVRFMNGVDKIISAGSDNKIKIWQLTP